MRIGKVKRSPGIFYSKVKSFVKPLDNLTFQISAELSHQDVSTHQLISSVNTITRHLSSQNQMEKRPGIRRSKSCFHVDKAIQEQESSARRKRSKSTASEASNLRRFRVVKIDNEVAHLIEENQDQEESAPRLRRSRTSRALRRVKTFLRPFRRTYQCAESVGGGADNGLGWVFREIIPSHQGELEGGRNRLPHQIEVSDWRFCFLC